MTDDQIAAEFAALIALSIMAGLVTLWLHHFADALREDLFALRDEMMIYAYREELIGNPAYRNLRFLINGFIRYAHKLSFSRLMLWRAARSWQGVKQVPPQEAIEWQRAVEALPAEQRTAFEQFNDRANMLVVKHMVLLSPIVWLFVLPGIVAHVRVIKPSRAAFNGLAKAMEPKMPMAQAVEGALHAARAVPVG